MNKANDTVSIDSVAFRCHENYDLTFTIDMIQSLKRSLNLLNFHQICLYSIIEKSFGTLVAVNKALETKTAQGMMRQCTFAQV